MLRPMGILECQVAMGASGVRQIHIDDSKARPDASKKKDCSSQVEWDVLDKRMY